MIGPDIPDYLREVTDFVLEQREKFKKGLMTNRDTAKALFMTIASQGSGSIPVEQIRRSRPAKVDPVTGKRTPPYAGVPEFSESGAGADPLTGMRYIESRPDSGVYLDPKTGEIAPDGIPSVGFLEPDGTIRPEGAAARFLWSAEGQQALDEIERGIFNEALWQKGALVRQAFGDRRFDTVNAFGVPQKGNYNFTNLNELTKALNATGGDPGKVYKILGRVNGIGRGKTGFMGFWLGFGERPTIDAREINYWVAGKGDFKKAETPNERLANAAKAKQDTKVVADALMDLMMDRFNEMRRLGLGADLPEEAFGAIMHHMTWDFAGNSVTTHGAERFTMKFGAGLPLPVRYFTGVADAAKGS
jgi:hypothetical protein